MHQNPDLEHQPVSVPLAGQSGRLIVRPFQTSHLDDRITPFVPQISQESDYAFLREEILRDEPQRRIHKTLTLTLFSEFECIGYLGLASCRNPKWFWGWAVLGATASRERLGITHLVRCYANRIRTARGLLTTCSDAWPEQGRWAELIGLRRLPNVSWQAMHAAGLSELSELWPSRAPDRFYIGPAFSCESAE